MTDNRLLTDEEQALISQEYPGYWAIEYPRAVAKAQRDLTASIKDAELRRAIETISACHEGELETAREKCQARVERIKKEIEDKATHTYEKGDNDSMLTIWYSVWQALWKEEGIDGS